MSNGDKTLAYVVHLRVEHRKLHDDLQRITRNWFSGEKETQQTSQAPRVVEALQALRTDLAEHFAEEEDGGCLEEAVCRCPRLGPEANRIEREHPALLSELDDIIARLSRSRKALETPGSQAKFESFARKLHVHEAAENRMLEAAFGMEDNALAD